MNINTIDNFIESDWIKIAKLNINSLYRLMAKFLLYINHDENEASRLLERFLLLIFLVKKIIIE